MEKIIGSLKEFIWDVIGYLIPGFLFILTFNFFIAADIAVEDKFLIDWKILNPTYIIIVLAYIMGFIIYSITLFKIFIQDNLINLLKGYKVHKYLKKYDSKFWEETFVTSATFQAAKDKLSALGVSNTSTMKINEVRNMFMSRNPEMDQKVYTFMFRSSVFDHVSTIMMLVVLMALLGCFLHFFDVSLIKHETLHIVLYFLFPFLCVRLGNAKRMFYSISQRIPMSNFK